MTLEQAILQRWGQDEQLAQLLPVAHVWTGWQNPDRLPGARIQWVSEEQAWLTAGRQQAERVVLKISVWCETLEQLRQVSERLKRVFHRCSLDLGEGARVIRLTCRRTRFERENHDVWRGEIDCDALTLRPVGSL